MTLGLVLSIIFMILKLTGHSDWSWWLVFLPVMIEFALAFLVALGVYVSKKRIP